MKNNFKIFFNNFKAIINIIYNRIKKKMKNKLIKYKINYFN